MKLLNKRSITYLGASILLGMICLVAILLSFGRAKAIDGAGQSAVRINDDILGIPYCDDKALSVSQSATSLPDPANKADCKLHVTHIVITDLTHLASRAIFQHTPPITK